jgi:hypothetical protein
MSTTTPTAVTAGATESSAAVDTTANNSKNNNSSSSYNDNKSSTGSTNIESAPRKSLPARKAQSSAKARPTQHLPEVLSPPTSPHKAQATRKQPPRASRR